MSGTLTHEEIAKLGAELKAGQARIKALEKVRDSLGEKESPSGLVSRGMERLEESIFWLKREQQRINGKLSLNAAKQFE